MKDDDKTREQLVQELAELRLQNAALKKSASAEKYRYLEDLREVIYELDSQGVVLYISPAIRDMLGYDSSDIVGKNFIELAHKEDQSSLSEWFSELRQGHEIPSEYRVHHKSGDLRWARTQTRPIMEDGLFKGGRGILLDVTAQKRVEESLRESEEKYRLVVDNMADVITVMGLNLRFTYVSPSVIRLRGYTAEEVMAQTLEQIMTPESLQIVARVFEEEMKLEASGTADLGRTRILELEEYKKDGSIVWVENHLSSFRDQEKKLEGLIALSYDITDRKRAEEMLRESEERFTKAFRSIPNALVISRLEDGKIVEVNDYWHKVFGYSRKEVIGKSSLALNLLADSDDRQRIIALLRGAGFVRDLELQIRQKSGALRTATLSCESMEIHGDQYLLSVVHDITESKQAEAALRESEARYRDLFENANEAIFVAQGGKLVLCNPRTVMISGYSAEELGSRPYIEFIHPDDRDIVIARQVRRRKGKEFPHSYAFRIIHKDGNVRWVELNVVTINWKGRPATLNFQSDITESKQAEKLIQKSEALLREAQQVAHIGHWELSDVSGIPQWSEEIFHIFGLDPAQGEPSFEAHQKLIHPDDWDILNNAVTKARFEGFPFDIEFRLLRPDASIRWVNAKGNISRDGEGHIIRIFGILQDITEHKQVEEKIQASLLEKATMLKEIHHRVKNNLQVIQSLFNLQVGKIKDPQALEVFNQSLDRIRSMSLVHEKLYHSPDLSRIDMADYLRTLCTHLFHSSYVSLNKVNLKLAMEEIQVGIDKAVPLGLIINELVSNGLKHAFPAGRAGEIRVGLALVDEGMIRLTVGDNGIGFPREMDFRKTESTGFQVVMALVQQLDGTIGLHQEVGTEFRITFPRKYNDENGVPDTVCSRTPTAEPQT